MLDLPQEMRYITRKVNKRYDFKEEAVRRDSFFFFCFAIRSRGMIAPGAGVSQAQLF